MFEISGMGILATFLAGIISFLSPCVLPLVPGYISYLAGRDALSPTPNAASNDSLIAIALSVCFVMGFSTVFMILGASATALGQILLSYRYELNLLGGAIVIVFGLFMLGIACLPMMQRDFRFQLSILGGKPLSAYVLGLAFGFGWTPCIGPILGAILTMSAAATTVADGVILLAIYSGGLGIPFILAAIFTDRLTHRIKSIGRAGYRLHQASGVIMILMGIFMMTGHLSALSYWLLDAFPVLGSIG